MRTWHAFPRRELRRLRRAWLKRNRRLIALVVVFALSASAAVAVPFVLTDLSARWYLLGLVHAAIVASVLHLLESAFLAHEATAVWQLRGAWGEENTRSELQRAKRRRLIWGWVDSITLQGSDLDHVVVTRSGGIVLLDSKWRSSIDAQQVGEMTASARRARLRAEAVVRTLLRSERKVRHRASGQSVTVTAAVVLWGAARQAAAEGREIDGVHFVDGRRLLGWLKELDGEPVDAVAARDLLAQLVAYRATAFEASQGARR